MRSLLIVWVLSSCDLQPGRSQDNAAKPAPAPPAPGSAAGNPNIPPGSGFVDAGVPRLIQTTEECSKVGDHVTNLVATANPALVQGDERGRMVRRIAETCTRDAWSADKRACFLASKTSQEAEPCGRDLNAPQD